MSVFYICTIFWYNQIKYNSSECIPTVKEIISKLKSLKDRVQPQVKQEWSEEDKEIIDYLIDYLESELDSSYTDLDKETFTKEINLLKSLKNRYAWRPSDEQMRVLDLAIRCGINRGTTEETTLVSLFNDLKKLK